MAGGARFLGRVVGGCFLIGYWCGTVWLVVSGASAFLVGIVGVGVFFSLAWLGRGVGFGGWLVGDFLVGIVGAGVFLAWAWIVVGARLSVLGVLWRLAVLLAYVDLLARDYFLLALVDWLVIGFGAGLWRGDWLLWRG